MQIQESGYTLQNYGGQPAFKGGKEFTDEKFANFRDTLIFASVNN
jgi:hypothetical protein